MIMRYAKSITLRIKLDPENEEMIFSPLLIVNYRERTKDNVNLQPLASVGFKSEYQMDSNVAINSIKGIFIAIMIIFGVIVVIQLIVWSCTPNLSDDATARF